MKNIIRYIGPVALIALVSGVAQARDLGTHGTTWPIAEPDMRIRMAYEASQHQWDAQQKQLQESAKKYPSSIPGWDIPACLTPKTRYVDPSYTLTEDVRKSPDANGQDGGEVLIPAGTTVNPLAFERPRDWLFVFDGSVQGQIEQAKALVSHSQSLPPFKLIALDGDLQALTEEVGVNVFRADEWLFTRAQVQESPSMVGVSDSEPLRIKVTAFSPLSPFDEFVEAMQ